MLRKQARTAAPAAEKEALAGMTPPPPGQSMQIMPEKRRRPGPSARKTDPKTGLPDLRAAAKGTGERPGLLRRMERKGLTEKEAHDRRGTLTGRRKSVPRDPGADLRRKGVCDRVLF